MHVLHLVVLAATALAQGPPPTDYLGAEKCTAVLSSAQSIITDIPEPDRFVSNMAYAYHYNRFTNSEDPCALPEVTGVSAAPFSEWAVSYTEWREEVITEYRKVWEACSQNPMIYQIVPAGPERCSSLSAKITGGGGVDGGGGGSDDVDNSGSANDSGDVDDSGSGDDGGSGDSGAFKETGSIVAVAALAGSVMALLVYL